MECKCGNSTRFEKVWFEQEERKVTNGITIKTGRYRKACSHIVCLDCARNHCVDDSFDGEWYRK